MDIWGSNKATFSACFPFRLQAKRHAKRAWQTQPESCLSCPNSKVLILTSYAVDTGSFPACYTAIKQRVRRLDYVQNIVDYSFVKLIKNFWEHFGHFRIIRLLFLIDASPWTAIAIAFSPAGLSHNLPRLHAGHLTKLLCIVSCSKICSIKSISSTLLSMLLKKQKTGRNG